MKKLIPYGRQSITEKDIHAVIEVLKSDFLTQGPVGAQFCEALAQQFKAQYASVTSNATLALYIAYKALGLKKNDHVWTVPNTFVATANAALLQEAHIEFIDIDKHTYCLSINDLTQKLRQARVNNALPKIVVPVHFAGQPCDMKSIHQLSQEYGFKVVEDASHAVGATYRNSPIGHCEFSDITIFSFHPVKIITTGEGGALLTNNLELKTQIDKLISHGITKAHADFVNEDAPPWFYEQQELSLNARLTDIQSALGLSQLKTLDQNISRRKKIAQNYRKELGNLPLRFQEAEEFQSSSWHLFVVTLEDKNLRLPLYNHLRELGVLSNVHYIPVFLQPYYKKIGYDQLQCPNSLNYYQSCLSLPMYHGLTDEEQDYVIKCVREFFDVKV